jgi:hypothetical protein
MQQSDINKMTASEKLQTMEFLWDSLVESKTAIESPQWHQTIISERQEKIKNGTAVFISLNELKKSNS